MAAIWQLSPEVSGTTPTVEVALLFYGKIEKAAMAFKYLLHILTRTHLVCLENSILGEER